MGVIALSGNSPLSLGKVLTRLHNRAIVLPQSIVVGISVRWFPVPSIGFLCQGKTTYSLPGLCDDLPAHL